MRAHVQELLSSKNNPNTSVEQCNDSLHGHYGVEARFPDLGSSLSYEIPTADKVARLQGLLSFYSAQPLSLLCSSCRRSL
jgi:hypothetical protein